MRPGQVTATSPGQHACHRTLRQVRLADGRQVLADDRQVIEQLTEPDQGALWSGLTSTTMTAVLSLPPL
jgi:hypothetical protein